jgi:hypothetical protein
MRQIFMMLVQWVDYQIHSSSLKLLIERIDLHDILQNEQDSFLNEIKTGYRHQHRGCQTVNWVFNELSEPWLLPDSLNESSYSLPVLVHPLSGELIGPQLLQLHRSLVWSRIVFSFLAAAGAAFLDFNDAIDSLTEWRLCQSMIEYTVFLVRGLQIWITAIGSTAELLQPLDIW